MVLTDFSPTRLVYTACLLCVLSYVRVAVAQDSTSPVRVVFLGNSLTSGYGLSIKEAYPALLQTRVDSLQWPVIMVNAGVSGDTSSGGLRRLGWQLRNPPDVLVVALGGNDGLRGILPTLTKTNLIQIVNQARAANPAATIIIAGMQMPPNLGAQFQEDFSAVFPAVAEETGATLIPFLLEGVGGIAKLNQSDGIHPTAAGQRILADNVWEILAPILQSQIAR